MPGLLDQKTAIVTGGTSGIGKGIAKKFLENGANVAIFGTNMERGKQVVKEMTDLFGENRILFFPVNVASKSEVDTAIKEVTNSFGCVDILVNNAGITRDQLLLRMSEADWDEVMAINVKSCYNTCHAIIRQMMKEKRGKIINITSVVGVIGNAGQVNYSASKAAMIGFTKSLAKEVAARNICVNGIAPGFIETRMTEEMTEGQKESIFEQIPFKRMGTPEDIANAALFLASELSDYMTGQVVIVDGGMAI